MSARLSPILLLLATAIVSSAGAVTAAADHQPEPLAAFVLLGHSGSGATVAMARVVLDGVDTACPTLLPTQGKGPETPMTARTNPDPENFPIQVCEAIYPWGAKMRISGYSGELPELSGNPGRVTVFGDTGCKPADQSGCDQHSRHHWPLRRMADAAATAKPAPELILHMGDYNYRGTPGHIHINGNKEQVYDAGDNTGSSSCKLSGPYFGQNSVGSDSPDQWDNWNKDFFEPTATLLRSAPWIFARGNHELCSRAGPGWFYLLDPGSELLGADQGQLSCPAAESPEPLVFREPYRVDIGTLSVTVLDSANACDQGSLHQGHFDAQFAQIQQLVGTAPTGNALWLQSHRPLWGVKKPEDDSSKHGGKEPKDSNAVAFIDDTLQTAYARHPVPQPLHLVLSGHMHRFQSISFPPAEQGLRPTQLIVGNGGVDLAHNYPKKPFQLQIDNSEAVGFGVSRFGYMEIKLKGEGAWTGKLIDHQGHTLANCDSRDWSATGACSPAGH